MNHTPETIKLYIKKRVKLHYMHFSKKNGLYYPKARAGVITLVRNKDFRFQAFGFKNHQSIKYSQVIDVKDAQELIDFQV
jgi:hypothetical protein